MDDHAPLSDWGYLLAMAHETRTAVGHTAEGRMHAERLEAIAAKLRECAEGAS